jgi:hypothetical protein
MIHHQRRPRTTVDQAERLPEHRPRRRATAGLETGPLLTAALLLLTRLLLGPPALTIPDAHHHHPISPPPRSLAIRYRSRSGIQVQPRLTTQKNLDASRPTPRSTRRTTPPPSWTSTSLATTPYTQDADHHCPELVTFAHTLNTWRQEIINAVLTGASNAGSEGINRIQKLDARTAFGY